MTWKKTKGRMKYCGQQFSLAVMSESCDKVRSFNSVFGVVAVIFIAAVYRAKEKL